MNKEKFAALSDENLQPITATNPEPVNPATVSGDDIFLTAKHTDINSNNPFPDSPGLPEQPLQAGTAGKTSNMSLGKMVQGKFAIDMMDLFMPALLIMIMDRIGYKLNKSDLKLTKDEKEILAEPMQEMLNAVNLNMNNPFINFAIVFGVVYGSKAMEKFPDLKKKTSKETKETVDTIIESEGASNLEKMLAEFDNMVSETVKKRKTSREKAKQWLRETKPTAISLLEKKYGHKLPS